MIEAQGVKEVKVAKKGDVLIAGVVLGDKIWRWMPSLSRGS